MVGFNNFSYQELTALTTGEDWTSLMVQAQGGDSRAYEQLLREISLKMRSFVAQRVRPDVVEDLLQDILLRVHAYRDSYSPDRPMKPWINSIARNVIIDFSEKRKKMVAIDDSGELESIAGSSHFTRESNEKIEATMKKMPDEQRVAFFLTKIEGLSIEEGAAITGISVPAFKSRTARSIKSFKKLLKDNE